MSPRCRTLAILGLALLISACGSGASSSARSAAGAATATASTDTTFYRPGDRTVYLDLQFFLDLASNARVGNAAQAFIGGVAQAFIGSVAQAFIGSVAQAFIGSAAQAFIGSAAQAFIVGHEFGHHVQQLIGIAGSVADANRADPSGKNARSVLVELQADCLAGVWGRAAYPHSELTTRDLDEALSGRTSARDTFAGH
jgi:predicted metalloprotease